MDEIWERAVESALDGQTDVSSVRTLTLDGAVKCVHGRLPPPSLFEKFPHLQHLSIANIGVSSLEQFPRLQNLQKLILSDNRIAGGLEFLVQAGLESLRDLDLSNNRIQEIDYLRPLAELRLVSLDLYECPVTRVKDYRSRVFGLIKSLKYLDKMDADENERPESDDEDDDEEEDDEEEEEDDPGSGEIDGEERGPYRLNNGHSIGQDGVVDVDEDEESDADEEEAEIIRGVNRNGSNQQECQANGFHHAEPVDVDDEEDDDDEDDNDSDEIDEEEDEEDVIEVHEVEDTDDEDGVENDDDDDDEEEDEEEVDNDDGDGIELESTGLLTSTEGEIDAHEHGEEDVDDDDGETGEEELGVDEADLEDEEDPEDEEEEDVGTEYLVQPVVQVPEAGTRDDEEEEDPELEEEEEDEDDEEEDEEEDNEVGLHPSSSSHKRKRDGDTDDDDDDGGEDDDDDDHHHSTKSSKQQ